MKLKNGFSILGTVVTPTAVDLPRGIGRSGGAIAPVERAARNVGEFPGTSVSREF